MDTTMQTHRRVVFMPIFVFVNFYHKFIKS